ATVPDTGRVAPGFSSNIAGTGSAWCGLRSSGDANAPTDSYTGNKYAADEEFVDFRAASSAIRSAWPGYASQWDQLMYKDFSYTGGGNISFDCRANSGAEPVDSFEVWVGAPKESGVYDKAHRYLSDTIDFGLGGADAPRILYSMTGVSAGSSGSIALPNGASWGTIRVVFRVKTNRFFDDARPASTPTATAWNSTTGAVVIDNVNVNGVLSDFESPSQILPRFTRTGNAFSENSPSSSWITTGRPPPYYGHIHNM